MQRSRTPEGGDEIIQGILAIDPIREERDDPLGIPEGRVQKLPRANEGGHTEEIGEMIQELHVTFGKDSDGDEFFDVHSSFEVPMKA